MASGQSGGGNFPPGGDQQTVEVKIQCEILQLRIEHIFDSPPRSESELFTGDASKDNHSPGPVVREVSP